LIITFDPQLTFLTERSKAHIAVLFTNIFFAVNYSLIKFISPSHIGPYGLNLLRVGISLLLFWSIWIMGKTKAGIRKEHIWRFVLCGLTGIALNQMLFIKGLTMTSTIHASLLMLCTPLLITLLAFWILKEKVTVAKIIGLLAGIAGATLLIASKESNGASSLRGDIFIILNAISYTLYFILVKPLMTAYSPVHVVRWVFTFGFIMVLPFGWLQFSAIEWNTFTLAHWGAVSFITICGTFLAYLFNVYGLQKLGAGITGSYIYTQPLFVATIAMIFIGERFTFEKIAAALLIFAGVFLVSKKTPPVVQE
jgi:drug/metabolite transporter (DMT)-like permease